MLKAIIVDDERHTREGLLKHLPWKSFGFDTVSAADNGLNALNQAMRIRPDLIVTDVKMPVMDGIKLAEKIKENLPNCKIIFLSSFTDKEYLLSAIQLQVIRYIEKPIDLEEMKQLLQITAESCNERKSVLQTESAHLSLLKEKTALELIKGRLPLDAMITRFEQLKLPVRPDDQLLTVVIKLLGNETDFSENSSDPEAMIVELIERNFEQHSLPCLYGFKDMEHLVIHIWESDPRVPKAKAVLIRILEQISALNSPIKSFIGVGNAAQNASLAPQSYQHAIVAAEQLFYLGYDQIHYYSDSDLIDEHASVLDQDFGLFRTALAEFDIDGASHFVRELAQSIREQPNKLVNNMKNIFGKLLMEIEKNAGAFPNGSLKEFSDREVFIGNALTGFHTLDEIEQYVIEKISADLQQNHGQETTSSITLNVTRFIHRFYHDTELSIKAIADHLYLTPNYLSLIFKKETGRTINQYITRYRVERAQELLRNQRAKLYEISEQVGFGNVNYFAKTFKKTTGLTPSEYREKYSQ